VTERIVFTVPVRTDTEIKVGVAMALLVTKAVAVFANIVTLTKEGVAIVAEDVDIPTTGITTEP
jgi:hypothetical protein